MSLLADHARVYSRTLLARFSQVKKYHGRRNFASGNGPPNAQQGLEDELLAPLTGPAAPQSGRSLYHAILVQLSLLPDTLCSSLIKDLVRARYIAARRAPVSKCARLRTNARKCLITLQKANMGNTRALTKVVETAFGQRGRLKHRYVALVTAEVTEPANELIPGRPRSRPPVVGARLAALWSLQFEAKKISLVLPSGPGGAEHGVPLARSREANLRWQHYTKLLERTLPPIPREHYAVLVKIAHGGQSGLSKVVLPAWRHITRQEMLGRRKGRGMGSSSSSSVGGQELIGSLGLRNVRRVYERVLRQSPVLSQSLAGTWTAHYYPGARGSADVDATTFKTSRPSSDFEPIE